MRSVRITQALSESEFAVARGLFGEYAKHLGVDLCFQGFGSELQRLESMYGPPAGCLLLAGLDEASIGCVGLRSLTAVTCEMKRLYVRDVARGRGIGRQLAMALIERARELGYERMMLDTLAGMDEARRLYASLGFLPCAPYYTNPLPGVVYMELALDAVPARPRS